MSSENISPDQAAAAQEFPDRVGFKPDNPFLVNFRPYIPPGVNMPELTVLPLVMGTFLGLCEAAQQLDLARPTRTGGATVEKAR